MGNPIPFKNVPCEVCENAECMCKCAGGECKCNLPSPNVELLKNIAAGAVLGTSAIVLAVPLAGFAAGGIAAGSVASGMMSAAAIANGGGIAAGSTVAILQSVGTFIGAPVIAGAAASGAASIGYLGSKLKDSIRGKL